MMTKIMQQLSKLNTLQQSASKKIDKNFSTSIIVDIHKKPLLRIITPFANFVGDAMCLYIKFNSDGTMTIDDDGETINNFVSMDMNLLTKQYSPILIKILHRYHIQFVPKYNMLQVACKPSDFPKVEKNILLAMIKIDGLYDVIKPLKLNDII